MLENLDGTLFQTQLPTSGFSPDEIKNYTRYDYQKIHHNE